MRPDRPAAALFALLVAASPASSGVEASAWALADLMVLMSRTVAASVAFEEEKSISLLDRLLVSRGHLHYRAPDYLRKDVEEPQHISYEVAGDAVEVRTGQEVRQLQLDDHPVLRAFVESYRATLAGDLQTLRRCYALELRGTPDDWRLELTPIEEGLRRYLTLVVIEGRHGQMTEVRVEEVGGDVSRLRLLPDG